MLDVVQKVNGQMVIVSSWEDGNKAGAKAAYHNTLRLLYSDADTKGGVVSLLDDNLDIVDGCEEVITK